MKDKTFPGIPDDENRNEDPEVYAVHWQGGTAKISRRNLLKAGGVLAAGATLAGCTSPTLEDAPEAEDPSETEAAPAPTPVISDWNCEDVAAHENQVQQLEITPDGGWALSIARDEPLLKLWSFPDGKTMKVLESTGAPVTSFVVSPEGDYVYSSDQSGVVVVWSLPDGVEVNNFVVSETSDDKWLHLSPDGQFLAVVGPSGTFAIFTVPDGTLVHTLEHPGAPWLVAEFSPDSQYVASFTYDNEAIVWSIEDGQPIVSVPSEDRFLVPIFTPDSQYCIMPDYDKIGIYSLPDGELVHNLEGYFAPISAQVLNEETSQLITGDEDGVIKIWSIPDGVEEYTWTVDNVSSMYLAEDENLLAIIKILDSEVSLNALLDGSEIASFDLDYRSADAKFSPDGKILVVKDYDYPDVGRVIIYDIEAQERLNETVFEGNVNMAFSPDSRFLLTGDGLGKMNLYSLEDGQVVACMVDLAVSGEDTEGVAYSIEVEGETVTRTLPCGSPLPPGAICVCDCVSGSGCACVGHTTCSCVGDVCSCVSHSSGTHYWYPN